MALKVLIFDLDDTLVDTSRLLVPFVNTPAYLQKITQPLPLMPGALENLQALSKKYHLYLLTQGNLIFQKQKIQSLGIEKFFSNCFFANIDSNEKKSQYFENIKKSLGTDDFLSIGNRRSTDIRPAKKVGGWTCLYKYGEHSNEPVECHEDIPDFEILNHAELISKCRL